MTTFGESHGPAIGCVVDGCPPRIALTERDIQPYLDRRRPGQSRFTTQRQEPDTVKILSGVFTDEATGEQVTTGTPIALLIEMSISARRTIPTSRTSIGPAMPTTPMTSNTACAIIAAAAAQSARETAMRVAAGAIARKIVPGLRGPRRAGADGAAPHRPRALGLGRGRAQSVLLS